MNALPNDDPGTEPRHATEPPAPSARPWRSHLDLPLFVGAALLLVAALIVHPWDAALARSARIGDGFHPPQTLIDLFRLIEGLGKADVAILIALAAGGLGKRKRATRALVALAIVGAVVGPLKLAVHRERPDGGAYSMPSGDTATAAACLVPLLTGTPGGRAVGVAMGGVVGFVRMSRGRHYLSDILVGLAIALIAAAAARQLVRKPWPLLTRRRFALAALTLGLAIGFVPFLKSRGAFRRFVGTFGPATALALVAALLRPQARLLGRVPERLPKPGYRAAWLLALLAAVLLFWLADASTLWDRDEPRFAEATLEMVHSGNWLVPTFNGELRPDKPILIYWLMSIPVRLFGVSEWTVRAVAPPSMALSMLSVFALGRLWLGPAQAWLAMAILALTPLTLVTGSAATTDALLLAWIAASLWWFERTTERGRWRKRDIALLGVLLGGALLTKGPVGLAVFLLAVMSRSYLGRTTLRDEPRPWRPIAVASALGLALFLAWAIPANQATGGAFAAEGIGHHVVGRALNPLEGHGGSYLLFLPFYALVIPIAFMPWTLYLPASLSALAGGRVGGERARALLLGWLVSSFVLVSLVATKLPHYIQPVWPVLALSVAATAYLAQTGGLAPRDRRWLRFGRPLMLGLLVPGGLALALAPWFLPTHALRYPAIALGLSLIVIAKLAAREHRAERHLGAIGVLVAGMVLLAVLAAAWLLPAVETYKVSAPLARAIRARTSDSVPVAMRKYTEPSLIFYLGRAPVRKLSHEELAPWFEERSPGVLVITRKALDRFERERGPASAEVIADLRGFNYSKGRWVEVLALGRALPPAAQAPSE